MLILVSGGAASGKSRYAEELTLGAGSSRRIYLATMEVRDGESRDRVARHRDMRAGKGFETLERPRDMEGVALPPGCAVLLEDLSNLAANEWFGPKGSAGAEERILAGLDRLTGQSERLVVVTNELFSDGVAYDAATMDYLRGLAELNRTLARRAGRVYEVVCGIPVCWKGELDE